MSAVENQQSKKVTIPVALVNGVYFPTQRLRFKINDASRRQVFNIRVGGFYGIVTKRTADSPLEASVSSEQGTNAKKDEKEAHVQAQFRN